MLCDGLVSFYQHKRRLDALATTRVVQVAFADLEKLWPNLYSLAACKFHLP